MSSPAGLVVAIDGPAGAGKSTVARLLARRLGGVYLDTGAMYRACTLAALRRQVDLEDPEALAGVVDAARLELRWDDEPCRVLLDGEDVTVAIRTREVTGAIHHLARCAPVRERLVAQQRALAAAADAPVVVEGRDIGSVVFPRASVKVYLDASVDERARRRQRDLAAAAPPIEVLREEIEVRDRRDSSRDAGPLVRVPDAIYVDTSDMSQDEVIEHLVGLVRRASPLGPR